MRVLIVVANLAMARAAGMGPTGRHRDSGDGRNVHIVHAGTNDWVKRLHGIRFDVVVVDSHLRLRPSERADLLAWCTTHNTIVVMP